MGLLDIHWTHHDDVSLGDLETLRIHALIAAPLTSTWTRARHQQTSGPQALRSAQWPWGRPEVVGEHRAKLERDNESLRQCIKSIDIASNLNPLLTFMLIAPEDRGATATGRPGSIWQLREIKTWAKRREFRRGAVNQCEMGTSATVRPTGVLMHPLSAGNIPRGSPFRAGWPRHSPPPGYHYVKPLPRRCRCGGDHDAAKDLQTNESSFSSHAVAKGFARLLLQPILSKRAAELGLLRKGHQLAQHYEAMESESEPVKSIIYEADSDTDQTWPEPELTEDEMDTHGDYYDIDLRDHQVNFGEEESRKAHARENPGEKESQKAHVYYKNSHTQTSPSHTVRASCGWAGIDGPSLRAWARGGGT